jgi:hypothetical protein
MQSSEKCKSFFGGIFISRQQDHVAIALKSLKYKLPMRLHLGCSMNIYILEG